MGEVRFFKLCRFELSFGGNGVSRWRREGCRMGVRSAGKDCVMVRVRNGLVYLEG